MSIHPRPPADMSRDPFVVFIILVTIITGLRCAVFHKSCFAIQQAGLPDGYYVIDPDQDGRDEFTVYCDTSVSPVTTILHHNQEARTLVSGYKRGGSYVAQLVYDNDVTYAQARSLVLSSLRCTYWLKMTCTEMDWRENWWESYFGFQYQWETLGGDYCLQEDGTRQCTCFANSGTHSDEGDTGNWPLFPIKALHMGDTDRSFEYGFHHLGPLQCYQGKNFARMFISHEGKRQTTGVLQTTYNVTRKSVCAHYCVTYWTCVAFNFQVNQDFICELLSVTWDAAGADVVNATDWLHGALQLEY